MWLDAILAYLHFSAIGGVASAKQAGERRVGQTLRMGTLLAQWEQDLQAVGLRARPGRREQPGLEHEQRDALARRARRPQRGVVGEAQVPGAEPDDGPHVSARRRWGSRRSAGR